MLAKSWELRRANHVQRINKGFDLGSISLIPIIPTIKPRALGILYTEVDTFLFQFFFFFIFSFFFKYPTGPIPLGHLASASPHGVCSDSKTAGGKVLPLWSPKNKNKILPGRSHRFLPLEFDLMNNELFLSHTWILNLQRDPCSHSQSFPQVQEVPVQHRISGRGKNTAITGIK